MFKYTKLGLYIKSRLNVISRLCKMSRLMCVFQVNVGYTNLDLHTRDVYKEYIHYRGAERYIRGIILRGGMNVTTVIACVRCNQGITLRFQKRIRHIGRVYYDPNHMCVKCGNTKFAVLWSGDPKVTFPKNSLKGRRPAVRTVPVQELWV